MPELGQRAPRAVEHDGVVIHPNEWVVHGEHETRSRPGKLAVHSPYVCAQNGANTTITTEDCKFLRAPAHLEGAEGAPWEITKK